MFNKSFTFLEDKTRWLYQKDLIKNWFNFLSWTTLTAIVFAMADKSESSFLLGFGFVSAILVFFYAWHTLFESVREHIGKTLVWH